MSLLFFVFSLTSVEKARLAKIAYLVYIIMALARRRQRHTSPKILSKAQKNYV